MAQPVHSEKEKAHASHVIFVIKPPDTFNILHLKYLFVTGLSPAAKNFSTNQLRGRALK